LRIQCDKDGHGMSIKKGLKRVGKKVFGGDKARGEDGVRRGRDGWSRGFLKQHVGVVNLHVGRRCTAKRLSVTDVCISSIPFSYHHASLDYSSSDFRGDVGHHSSVSSRYRLLQLFNFP